MAKKTPFKTPDHIKGLPLKVKRKGDDWKEKDAIWHSVSTQVQQLHNFVWRFWASWHTQQGNAAIVKQWMTERRAWQKAAKAGKEPGKNCPVEPWPKAFAEALRKAARDEFPCLNDRPMSAVMQKLMGTIKTRGGTRTAFKQWQQILADEAGIPGYVKPLPIPLDNRRAKLLPPLDAKSDWRVEFRIDRIPDMPPGARQSHCFVVEVEAKKWAHRTLERILAGEYARKGANLEWNADKRCWFIQLCYVEPPKAKADVDAGKVAVLRACVGHPLEIAIDGDPQWIGGRGDWLTASINRYDLDRRERNDNYRYTSGAAKGHGRKRAHGKTAALSRALNRVIKTANHQFCRRAIDWCIAERCGKLVLDRRPVEGGFFLDNSRGKAGWAWFQLESFLKRECDQLGVVFEVVKNQVEKSGI